MGAFETFYASALQHPWLLWAAAAAAAVFCATRPGMPSSTRRYCALLVALSLADAWLTSSHVYGLGALPVPVGSLVPLFFVLAGDLRFLLLFDAAAPGGELVPTARALGRAAALTALVPIASQLVLGVLPESAGETRVLFLVYELLFAGLTLALLRRHPGVLRAPWIARVCRFVLLYYGLWATADALILAGLREPGFALRVVPNVLYYGGLIAAIGGAAAAAGERGDPSQPAGQRDARRAIRSSS